MIRLLGILILMHVLVAPASASANNLLTAEPKLAPTAMIQPVEAPTMSNDLIGMTIRERARGFLRGLGEGDLLVREGGRLRKVLQFIRHPFQAIKARRGGC